MKKIFLLVVLLFSVSSIWSQRNQIIAYMDMEYILENVPEYIQAQNTLDAKVAKWRKKLDDQARHIEVLKSDLANEKAILTKELIEEKEEEISIKQVELRRLESLYFGPNGDLFLVRKQLVKPIQDQVYNAVQSIAKRKNYDFVFEKSSDLVMLYSNKKYDISELVLSTIDRTRLQEQKKEERNKKKAAPKKEVTKVQQEKIEQKEALQNKKIEAVAKKIAEQEAKKKEIADKRKALMKQREEKRKLLRQKKEEARKKKEEEKKEKEKEKNKEDN
ncbi:OmpH family outer membrane protein [Polaribacter sp. MED152]|uniref:OmpH family outer membrane protein n=1 Tax=Polaribacter sp. MED152 TaxID=313598 RepID=UPI000186F4EE|nr:OmpH family outer membrane protein [Polaribacter sp. MED152]EAQ42491.2 outer membrane protein (OmpH-like) [Polaribacter sp. MED152]